MLSNSICRHGSQIDQERITKNRFQLSENWRLSCSLSLSFLLILSMAGMLGFAQSGPQPGSNQPGVSTGQYNLFPSHDLMAFIPEDNMIHLTPYSADANLNMNPLAYEYPQPYQAASNQLVGASGRILSPDKAQVVYARRSGSNVAVTFYGPASVQPSTILPGLADRINRPDQGSGAFEAADFMDIAASDLDKLPDAAGDNHDEVIVAYAGPGQNNRWSVNLAVVDYTSDTLSSYPAPVATTTAILSHTIDPARFSSSPDEFSSFYMLPHDNVLAVASGDFDGDGQNEIAVLHLEYGGMSWLTTFRYTNDGKGNRTLKEVSSVGNSPTRGLGFGASVDLAAGDFNGDGNDELVVNNLQWNLFYLDDYDNPFIYAETAFATVQGDANLNLTYVGRYEFQELTFDNQKTAIPWGNYQQYPRVQLVGGLFKFDPNTDPSLNRRQFAIAWNPTDSPKAGGNGVNKIGLATFDVSNDLKTITPLANTYLLPTYGSPQQRFSIAAGNFRDNSNIQDPLWSLAVLNWSDKGVELTTLKVTPSAIIYGQDYGFGDTRVDTFARMPVVAADLVGKSIYLGAAVHFTIDGMVSTDFVLYEPPKHAYWDNGTFGNSTSGTTNTVQNNTRSDDFYVSMTSSTGQQYSGTSKNTSNWSIGGSLERSSGATAKGNFGLVKAELTADATDKTSYDYNRNKENYNSNNSSRTVGMTSITNEDDVMQGRYQSYDIWRYRVYGSPNTQSPDTNAFYDLVLPGQFHPFSQSGLGVDWYQPLHENGNLLSYPGPTAATYTPPDLGAYYIPCPSESDTACVPCNFTTDKACALFGGGKSLTKPVHEPMVPVIQDGLGGGGFSDYLDYSSTVTSGGSFTSAHTLSESIDVKLAYKAEVDVPDAGGAGIRFSADFQAHNSNSWGKMTTTESTATSNTNITLKRVVVGSDIAYNFYPSIYTAQDGSVKAAHAVGLLENPVGNIFYKGLYGDRPDPALNLPSRFKPYFNSSTNKLTGWDPEHGLIRKQIRGFFLTKPDLNPVTNDYDYLAENPVATDDFVNDASSGDKVRVAIRVYNYSAGQPISNLLVRFQAIAYDQITANEIDLTTCPPNPAHPEWATPVRGRCTIGEASGINIDPWPNNTALATTIWDSSGFGPSTVGANTSYRIYAVLDPDNAITNEIYESEDPNKKYDCKNTDGTDCALNPGVDPGQNNEGWGLVTVTHPLAEATARMAQFEADNSLHHNSIAVKDRIGRIKTQNLLAEVNQPVSIRVKVGSDRSHRGIGHLLFYDGDPQNGGRMIAGKLVHMGNVNGSYVWLNWIPRTTGRHHLYAELLERRNDSKKNNNIASVIVDVKAKDETPPQLRIELSPNTIWPPNNRMVPVRATIIASDDQDAQPEIRLEAITHNEGGGVGDDVARAELGTDDREFLLRAKRAGKSKRGRVYEVYYSVTDWAGNRTLAKAEVIVPHDQGKNR